MDTEKRYHQSYLASVTRRSQYQRIRYAHQMMLFWCALAILYVATVAVVVCFQVYDG